MTDQPNPMTKEQNEPSVRCSGYSMSYGSTYQQNFYSKYGSHFHVVSMSENVKKVKLVLMCKRLNCILNAVLHPKQMMFNIFAKQLPHLNSTCNYYHWLVLMGSTCARNLSIELKQLKDNSCQ